MDSLSQESLSRFGSLSWLLNYRWRQRLQEYSPRIFAGTYDYLICSFGGVGTTMVIRLLQQVGATNCPEDSDCLKHLTRPPAIIPSNTKVIYIYGDPVAATVSLFRRNYAVTQSWKLRRLGMLNTKALAEYTSGGRDQLGLGRHLRRWCHIGARVGYPILFLQFEELWKRQGLLEEFVGHKLAVPERRPRSVEAVDAAVRDELRHLYKGVYADMDRLKGGTVL